MSAASSRAGRDSGRDTALFVSIVFVAVVVLALHILRYGNFIADDAGITFAYAKNLARGHGLVLNPGTDPIEGYSNFAWLLVVLPFCAGGADPTVPIKALSFVLAAATLIAVGSVGRRIARESDVPARSWLAGLAPLGLAAFAPYAMWTSSGMENGLYCALFVAAIWFYLRESDAGCAIALLVLALTRVEGVGIAALFALHRAGSLIVDRRPPRRSEILGAAMFAAMYAAYLAWHWWYFRALLPNSYMAKSTALRNGTLESAWEAIRDGWHYTDVQLVQPYRLIVGVPLAIVGLLAMSRSMRALAALLTAGILFLVCVSGGDFYPQFRMGTLLLPLWFLLVVEGMRVLLLPIRSAAVATAAVLVPIAIMCQPTLAVASVTAAGPLSLAVLKPFTADRFAALARNVRHRPITVMEADIGNVAYFTDFAILDLGGLANLEVARNGYTADQFRHYIFEEMKPDVIHLRGIFGWHTNLPVAMMQRSYRPVDGQSTESYATGWWVRRDDVETRPSFPSAASGAAEIYAAVARACDDADGGACHNDAALSRQALERADRLRREGAFAFAFEWYAAAWEADRRNVLALRGREDMRLPGLQGCANAPAAPSHLHASLSGSTVTLSWDPVESASAGYLIEARSSQGIPTSFDSAAPTLTVREVGREVYRVHVRARNRCGAGAASNELVVTVR